MAAKKTTKRDQMTAAERRMLVMYEHTQDQIRGIHDGMIAFEERLNRRIDERFKALEDRVSALEAATRQNSADIRELQVQIRELQVQMEHVKRKLDGLTLAVDGKVDRRELAELEARVAKLEQRVGI